MEKGLISVIIPIYNREKLIERCIDSVLAQENVKTEIICVDDGSTDSSLEICKRYAVEHDNIVVIHKENGGVSSTRNVGLDSVHGEYIFWLDSDDSIPKGGLIALLNAIKDNDVDFVMGVSSRINRDGTVRCVMDYSEEIKNRVISSEEYWKWNTDDNNVFMFTVIWGKLYKSSVWANRRFAVGVDYAEDELILPELISGCKNFYVLDKKVYEQHMSLGSVLRSDFNIQKLNSSKSKLSTARFLCEKGYFDYAVKKWVIAAGELVTMTKKVNDKESQEECMEIFKGLRSLALNLLGHMGHKKRVKSMAFMLGYPLYFCLETLKK